MKCDPYPRPSTPDTLSSLPYPSSPYHQNPNIYPLNPNLSYLSPKPQLSWGSQWNCAVAKCNGKMPCAPCAELDTQLRACMARVRPPLRAAFQTLVLAPIVIRPTG